MKIASQKLVIGLQLGAALLPLAAETSIEPKPVIPASSFTACPSITQEIDALLQSFVREEKLSSVAALVAGRDGILYHQAFGWKDLENRIPASTDDYYVLFSQTKAITTVAFMMLVEDGLVSVEDPVARFFPGIPDTVVTAVHEDGSYDTRPVTAAMTFEHLMAHTSGLGAGLVGEIRRLQGKPGEAPAGFGGPIPETPPAGQRTGGGNLDFTHLEEAMLELAQYPLGFDPGTQWDYHISTNMLGYLIELISGQSLRAFVSERILLPLGMVDTDWYYPPESLSRFVKAHRIENGQLLPATNLYSEGTVQEPQTYVEGAIGLNGPIADFARFSRMLLNGGTLDGVQILKPETIEMMVGRNRLPGENAEEASFQFGLGFELHRKNKPVPAVSDSAYAWGGMFGTSYIIDPENDLVALFYTNMIGAEPLYPRFLEHAYRLAAARLKS